MEFYLKSKEDEEKEKIKEITSLKKKIYDRNFTK